MSDFQIRVIVKYLRNIFVKILWKLCEENLLIVKVSDSLEKLCMNFNVEIEYCENYMRVVFVLSCKNATLNGLIEVCIYLFMDNDTYEVWWLI